MTRKSDYLECERKCPICKRTWFGKAKYHASDICSDVCFFDDLWLKHIENHKKKPYIIVDGVLYSDGGNVENPRNRNYLGHAGRVFRIRMGDQEWETNNLWCGGSIPEKYRDVLSDNAEFVRGRVNDETSQY